MDQFFHGLFPFYTHTAFIRRVVQNHSSEPNRKKVQMNMYRSLLWVNFLGSSFLQKYNVTVISGSTIMTLYLIFWWQTKSKLNS